MEPKFQSDRKFTRGTTLIAGLAMILLAAGMSAAPGLAVFLALLAGIAFAVLLTNEKFPSSVMPALIAVVVLYAGTQSVAVTAACTLIFIPFGVLGWLGHSKRIPLKTTSLFGAGWLMVLAAAGVLLGTWSTFGTLGDGKILEFMELLYQGVMEPVYLAIEELEASSPTDEQVLASADALRELAENMNAVLRTCIAGMVGMVAVAGSFLSLWIARIFCCVRLSEDRDAAKAEGFSLTVTMPTAILGGVAILGSLFTDGAVGAAMLNLMLLFMPALFYEGLLVVRRFAYDRGGNGTLMMVLAAFICCMSGSFLGYGGMMACGIYDAVRTARAARED